MKFFHIADLHFGKTLHNVPLIEEDQPFWVEQFVKAVDTYQPDAVVIAGDVYDRRVPSPEAMTLFGRLLTELAVRDKYVFVIPGNHDSAVRLSHVNSLLASHKIYIAGEVNRKLTHVTVPGKPEDVTFWLMPYVFPKHISDERVLGIEGLSTYDEAVRALLEAQDLDRIACNVLVAHQNVLANGVPPEHSESETIIGGLGEIEYTAFDAFDYVALGHIHNAQKIGRETVRYAGCPLYYDFSELNRNKDLTMVTINSKNSIEIERIEIPLLHRLLQKTGTLEELLASGLAMENKKEFHIQCVLTDKHVPPRAMEQLREVYGSSLVNVKRGFAADASSSNVVKSGNASPSMSLEEQFGAFFREQQNELLNSTQEKLIRMILEQQTRYGEEFFNKSGEVPATESQELLDYLLEATKEDTQ